MKLRFFNLFCLLVLILASCLPKKDKSDLERLYEISQTVSDNMSGEELAQSYCSSCHGFTDPKLLDKETWKKVLPQMGVRMGLRTEIKDPYKNMSSMDRLYVKNAGIFPEVPLLTPEQWYKIKIYFYSHSPERLPEINRNDSVLTGHPLFKFKTVRLDLPVGGLTTMIRKNPFDSSIYVGDGRNILMKLNSELKIENRMQTPSPPLDMEFMPDGVHFVTCVGIIHPHDQPLGSIFKMENFENEGIILENLKRPVSVTVADMNIDNNPDLIISEYGNMIGELSLYEEKQDGTYDKYLLEESPGSVQSYVDDFNKDGRPDIISLFAQGNESIYLFLNKGQNRYNKKQILQFPAVYGSSYFNIADFNEDGHLDIVYIHGDNADFSFVLKPYHGVRIYLNDGKNNFKEAYFFPMYGASYGSMDDFDRDGDQDIVVLSFFPDFELENPEYIIYLENNSDNGLKFKPYTFEGVNSGRWIVVTKMDYDNDSDMDLIFGSFTYSPAPTPADVRREWQRENHHLGVLENQLNIKNIESQFTE